MKKKRLSKTYLREAERYRIKFFLDEEDFFVVVKKFISITKPYIIHQDVVGMDNGTYIVEVVPKKEHYAMRVFLNQEKEIVEYYFDIIKESGLEEETNIPYFMDLYLDITMTPEGEINILDEEELIEAVKENDITKEDYEIVIKTRDLLLKELQDKTNPLLKIDLMKYIGDF